MKPVAVLFCLCVIGLLLFLVFKAGEAEAPPQAPALSPEKNIDESVSRVNAWLRQRWSNEDIEQAGIADDLTVYRRLSLALHGTIPSLEEITSFDADASDDRLERWLLKMLADKRFPEYFSDRLERVLTGVDPGQFIVFRRDRLRDWLSRQLQADRPWPEMTTELIAGDGLWTSHGATNFITAASVDKEGLDENKLAGRTVRAFLGQRIDCAQCHDHPFDDKWKQQDFEGLAAWFGQARVTPGGVIDRLMEKNEVTNTQEPVEYRVTDPGEQEGRVVQSRVPFHEEWITAKGSRRQQLALWVTHPDNRRFERAIANRIWGLMFGRAWQEPVDDVHHPRELPGDFLARLDNNHDGQLTADEFSEEELNRHDAMVVSGANTDGNHIVTMAELQAYDAANDDLLDILGREFRAHDGSLQFLIRLIAQSDVFRLKSAVPGADEDLYSRMSEQWAVFPMVRLRPEQMIGSMFQAGSVRTIDQNSNLFVRFARFINESGFLKQYGDAADDELLQQSGTIPQALIRLNGEFTRGLTETSPLMAAGQIMMFSGEDEPLVRNCFLACLSREPSTEEQDFFVAQLRQISNQDSDDAAAAVDRRSRDEVVRDLYWVLFNSPEFSWNQ